MVDAIFAERRLAEIYDVLDDDRSDLDAYVALVGELGASTVVDIGCGTGTFACLLASRGMRVTGVDPAVASLDVARRKPGADQVRWILGDATALPPLAVDVVTMTGNVAQVFLTDEDWDRRFARPGRRSGPGASSCSRSATRLERGGWSGTGSNPTGERISPAANPSRPGRS